MGMLEPKSVILEARKDMEVSVKDFLSGGDTIGKKEVDAVTTHVDAPKCRGQSLTCDEHACSNIRFDVSQIRGVLIWDNKQVPRIDRLNVHECANLLVPINDACRFSAGNNFTEDTGVRIVGHVA